MDLITKKKLVYLMLWRRYQKKKQNESKKRRWWVRPIFTQREELGVFPTLIKEMEAEDSAFFFNYHRCTVEQFKSLARKLRPIIGKLTTNYRKPVSVEERLSVTLRYLASGDLQRSLSFNYRLGRNTVSKIIAETTEAIWEVLKEEVMPNPTQDDFFQIVKNYWELWQFPNCAGAIDGKHIILQAPENSGSEFYNYKHTHSIILLAICDAKYRFIAVDVGDNGRHSDGGVFAHSQIGQSLENQTFGLLPRCNLPGSEELSNCAIVGDDAFPLKSYCMCPYAGKNLSEREKIFNYRLSRARRCIENAFGILASRWRIFRRPINTTVKTATNIVLAAVTLHNWLAKTEEYNKNRKYMPNSYIDYETATGEIIHGEWRNITEADSGMVPLKIQLASNNYGYEAKRNREILADFFLTPFGSLPWQEAVVRRSSKPIGINK